MRRRAIAAGAVLGLALLVRVEAGALRVAPVLLDVSAPQQASSLRVWNDGAKPVNVQVRVMRWRQVDGADLLEPTDDVVVSPPISTLSPGGENLIRVVRVSKAAVQAEESYRLLVDELPDPAEARGGAVTLVLRHSIPVFFGAGVGGADVAWQASSVPGGIRVTAMNGGTKRLRIANLKIVGGGGVIGQQDGLVGYVLSGQSASWVVPASGQAAGQLVVSADSETGRFDVVAAPVDR